VKNNDTSKEEEEEVFDAQKPAILQAESILDCRTEEMERLSSNGKREKLV
jgi:hypothetical protein